MSNPIPLPWSVGYDLLGRVIYDVDLPPPYEQTPHGVLDWIRDAAQTPPGRIADLLEVSQRTLQGYRSRKPVPEIIMWRLQGLLRAGTIQIGVPVCRIAGGYSPHLGRGQTSTPSETATRDSAVDETPELGIQMEASAATPRRKGRRGAAADQAPPAADRTPPAADHTPPAAAYAPPADDHPPPAADPTPPAADQAPPAAGHTPPAADHTPAAAEMLHDCPHCGRGGFTQQGLRRHRCSETTKAKPTATRKAPKAKGGKH